MKPFIPVMAAASLLAFSSAEATTERGPHDALEVAAVITPGELFDDTQLVGPLDTSSVFSTAVTDNLTSLPGLDGGEVSLFETGSVDILIGSATDSDPMGSTSYSFGSVASGDHSYRLMGAGTGAGTGTATPGGVYTLSSTVSPKPMPEPMTEPQTSAILLAGLGVIGFLALRRQ